jgi:hypothetical protein
MNRKESYAKLSALHHVLARFLSNPRGQYYDPKFTLDLFHRYVPTRDELIKQNPGVFGDLPIREIPKPSTTSDYEGRGYIERSHLSILNDDIEYCLELLSRILDDPPKVQISGEGIFFSGQYFDALSKAREILTKANMSVVIIDRYIGANVLELLTGKKPSVRVQILTKDLPPDIKAAAEAFNKQYGGITIRASDAFHDRFIIIDDVEYYHFGASIKDLGKRGFMFSRIEEPQIISDLSTKLASEWSKATIVL